MSMERQGWSLSPLRSIELFTGAGGLALAAHQSGFEHEVLVEWDKDACATLRENIASGRVEGIQKWRVLEADARKVRFDEYDHLDLVAGGPPCQPFSIGGKHRGHGDSRDMIPQFIRAVREARPKAFVLENVKGLTRSTFRNYLQYVILQLTYPDVIRKRGETSPRHLSRLEAVHTSGSGGCTGYNVITRVLNAADYGVPQTRERILMVGIRIDLAIEWNFPEPTHGFDALLRDQWITGEYWDRHRVRKPRSHPVRLTSRIARLRGETLFPRRPWRTVRDAIADLPAPRADRDAGDISNHRLQPGARAYPGHTGSPVDLPSKTLKAGVHGVPGGENTVLFPDGRLRYLTIREAARVQTFPDGWRFRGPWSEAMRQLGNAVPAALARSVVVSVAKALRGTSE